MSRKAIPTFFFFFISLITLESTASDFPCQMNEQEAWSIVDSVRAENGWLDCKPLTPLMRARNADYDRSDVLIVYFEFNNRTVNVRVDLNNRVGQINMIDHHPPSAEDVESFFDTSYVSRRIREDFPGDTLSPPRLYYAGQGSSSEYIRYVGPYYSFYNWSDSFVEYLYLVDGRIIAKVRMQQEYKEFLTNMMKAERRR